MSETKAEPLRFRNWERFQHYRDRRPPWIKLHRTLIDDADYHNLSGIAGKYLPMAWIVASEGEPPGFLPCVKTLAFRLRVTEAVCKALLQEWLPYLEHDASTALAGCSQGACPETEREGEAEREAETHSAHVHDAAALKPTRARNALMDALMIVESGTCDGATKVAWSKVAKALSEIKGATPEVTPEEIARRATNYKRHFDGAVLTSTALASHWARCNEGKPARGMENQI